MAARFPDNGRVLVAQLSVLLGLPTAFLLLRVLPRLEALGGSSTTAATAFGATLFGMGITISW